MPRVEYFNFGLVDELRKLQSDTSKEVDVLKQKATVNDNTDGSQQNSITSLNDGLDKALSLILTVARMDLDESVAYTNKQLAGELSEKEQNEILDTLKYDNDVSKLLFSKINKLLLTKDDEVKRIFNLIAWKQATDAAYVRSRGWSGLNAVRQYTYHGGVGNLMSVNTSDRGSPGHIHNHPEFGDLLGTGEVWVVINGMQLKARHRDHHLESPKPIGSAFLATDKIMPPALPTTVTGTIEEQSTAVIDLFTRYNNGEFPDGFASNLTALEVWIEPYADTFSDTFHSKRHALQTNNMVDALRTLLHFAASGLKDRFENQAIEMPLVAYVDQAGNPLLGILRYRMSCCDITPLGDPRKFITPHEDLIKNVGYGHESQRFVIKEENYAPGFLDKAMGSLPGLDGTGCFIAEEHYRYGQKEELREYLDQTKVLNAGYYSRFAQALGRDASNQHHFIRSDYDPYLFTALNTRPEVLGMEFGGVNYRWSWAIPMEIVIRHPLETWNPYNVPLISEVKGFTYGDGGSQSKPIPGINPDYGMFFKTPAGVFAGSSKADKADTATGEYWVTCGDGEARKMRASGSWIETPPIKGTSSARLRYPIHPEHQEGDKAYAEAKATYKQTLGLTAYTLMETLDNRVMLTDLAMGVHNNVETIGKLNTVVDTTSNRITIVNAGIENKLTQLHKLVSDNFNFTNIRGDDIMSFVTVTATDLLKLTTNVIDINNKPDEVTPLKM